MGENERKAERLLYNDNGILKHFPTSIQAVSVEPSKRQMRKYRKILKRLGYLPLSAAEQCFVIIKYVVKEKVRELCSWIRRRSK